MNVIQVGDKTFERFSSLLNDLIERRKTNIDHDDMISELIDVYQQNNWDQDMAAGG